VCCFGLAVLFQALASRPPAARAGAGYSGVLTPNENKCPVSFSVLYCKDLFLIDSLSIGIGSGNYQIYQCKDVSYRCSVFCSLLGFIDEYVQCCGPEKQILLDPDPNFG
jgi:hypothetical protein